MRDDGCDEILDKQWRGFFTQDLETFSTCREMTNLQIQLSTADHCQLIHSDSKLNPDVSYRHRPTSGVLTKEKHTIFGGGAGNISSESIIIHRLATMWFHTLKLIWQFYGKSKRFPFNFSFSTFGRQGLDRTDLQQILSKIDEMTLLTSVVYCSTWCFGLLMTLFFTCLDDIEKLAKCHGPDPTEVRWHCSDMSLC